MARGTDPDLDEAAPAPGAIRRRARPAGAGRDRSLAALAWYRLVQQFVLQAQLLRGGIRATGRRHVPERGGVLLISNHLSHLDVFVLGLLLPRTLNYVARSTLFTPVLAPLIRSVGGFPIQRDGFGAQGMKETLRRLRAGGIVTFFPEGTRSRTGEVGPLKPGVAVLAQRAGVPIVPAGIAGTFEAWPRGRRLPRPHPIRVHYGRAIQPADLAGLEAEAVVALLSARLRDSVATARRGLRGDLGNREDIAIGGSERID
jgi:1-acyl-sn-glycerol-3-phosphate acyltransferase